MLICCKDLGFVFFIKEWTVCCFRFPSWSLLYFFFYFWSLVLLIWKSKTVSVGIKIQNLFVFQMIIYIGFGRFLNKRNNNAVLSYKFICISTRTIIIILTSLNLVLDLLNIYILVNLPLLWTIILIHCINLIKFWLILNRYRRTLSKRYLQIFLISCLSSSLSITVVVM